MIVKRVYEIKCLLKEHNAFVVYLLLISLVIIKQNDKPWIRFPKLNGVAAQIRRLKVSS